MSIAVAKFAAVGFNDPGCGWRVASHQHPDFQMIVVTAGYEDVVVPNRQLRAGVGDILMIRPGVAHEEWCGVEHSIQSYFMNFWWPPGDTAAWPLHSVDEQGRIRMLISWLHAGRDANTPETRAAEESFFLALIREFIRLQGRQEDPLVAAIREFVRQNIAQPLTVDTLARHVALSKFHFIRRYRQLTGRSPMQDVRIIRVAHARDMLLTSHLPVKAIAPLAGLGDEISLYRLFRRYQKMTPGQLRRTVRRPASRRPAPE